MLTLIVTFKALVETALLALAGRAMLGLLAGAAPERNAVYRLFDLLSQPPQRIARWISPRVVLDRHMPLVATLLMVWVWLALTIAKLAWCTAQGALACA